MKRSLYTAAVAVLVGTQACGDGSGPGVFNPVATGQKINAAMTALDNQAIQSLDVLSSAFTFSMTAPPAMPAGEATAAPAGIIPCAPCMGKTFGYSTQSGKYQPTDQPGAPAAGIRYLLYAVDPLNRVVRNPLQQAGILDLTDKASSAANTLGVKAIVDNVTVLDYDASASITSTSFSLAVKGYVTGGTERLDFDLSQTVNATSGDTRVDYKLTSPTHAGLTVAFLLTGKLGASKNATLTITEDGDKLEITANGTAASSTGTVKLNGTTLANVTDTDHSDPVFTAVGGRVLSPADTEALVGLFNRVDSILAKFDDVLIPASFVFGISR